MRDENTDRLLGLAAAAGIVLALAGGQRAKAETITHLEGALRTTASFDPFASIGGRVGSFTIDSSGSEDVRETPGTLVLTTYTGSITATAAAAPSINGVRRIDPATARPLRADRPEEKTCTTGAESGCWHPGDPLAQNLDAFDALCQATRGSDPLDSEACRLTMWNSQVEVIGVSIAELLAAILSGSAQGRAALASLSGLSVSDTFPIVNLNRDPADGPPNGIFGSSSLSARLTSEQRSALGCGDFWARGCDIDGIDLARSEAQVLLQSWPATPTDGGGASRDGVAIAGTRPPEDDDYDALVDGCVAPGPLGCNSGDGGRPSDAAPLLHPASSTRFSNELAAASWNLLAPLVATSAFEGGCSHDRPDLCSNVIALRSYLTTQLDDDPSGPPSTRWLWESGAEYVIEAATGDLVDFQGGVVHLLGPEESRVMGAAIGAAIVLVSPAGVVPESASPLVRQGVGYAYAVVPEPDAVALGWTILGALGFAVRRSRLAPA